MEIKDRFISLDVFRGMTVCFMIIVNTPGSWSHLYAPLAHASWHGFTPTDLVFPSFLFAVGNAMAFSMPTYFTQQQSVFWVKVLKRTLLIFLIGYLMYWFPFVEQTEDGWRLAPITETRIPGVLQRIALCYLMASVIIRYTSLRGMIIAAAVLLSGYWLVMYLFDECAELYCLEGNAARLLDLFLLPESHLYHGEGVAFDPEGLLSTIPAAVNVLGGYWAGKYIKERGASYESIAKLLLVGGLLIVGAFTWDMAFPINKKIWTSSYVLLTVGIGFQLLAGLIYIFEIRQMTTGQHFFLVFGRNPLFIYVLSSLLLQLISFVPVGGSSLNGWFYHSFLEAIFPAKLASLVFALVYMMICWGVGWWLDRRKIYIRV